MFIDIDYDKRKKDYKLFLAKPNKEIITRLVDVYGVNYGVKFGNINELSFSIPYFVDSLSDRVENEDIESIREKMYLKIEYNESEEWLIIDEINDVGSGDEKSLSVTAFSNAYENSHRRITEMVLDTVNPEEYYENVLNDVSWSIGEIDPLFENIYRTVELSNVTVLEAIITGAETFGAIIEYDSQNKKINLRDINNLAKYRGLNINYSNFLQSVNRKRSVDEMVTRLYVYGENDLSIENVNPTGLRYLEDFSYFLFPFERDSNKNVIQSSYYMSDELAHAILDINEMTENSIPQIKSLQEEIDENMVDLINESTVLSNIRFDLSSARGLLDIAKATGDNDLINQRTTEVSNLSLELSEQEIVVNNLESIVEDLDRQISLLQRQISVTSFSEELYDELKPYIIEKEFRDDRYIDEEELYDDAVKKFDESRNPTVLIEASIDNIISSLEEEYYSDKIKLGDIARVTDKDMRIDTKSYITEIKFNLDEDTIDITLSSGDIEKDGYDRILSVLYDTQSTTTMLESNKHKWDSVTDIKTEVDLLRDGEIDATKRRITAGVNESVKIEDRGIVLSNPDYPDEMVIMQAGVIALSTDGGETWSTSITPRGIIADTIIGKLVASNNLMITNDQGSFRIDNEGLTVDMDSIKIMSGEGGTPQNVLDSWNEMLITMDEFANDNQLNEYEKNQIARQWNSIAIAHSSMVETIQDAYGPETEENPYPVEYEQYMESYEELRGYLNDEVQSDGHAILDENNRSKTTEIDGGRYNEVITNYETMKDKFQTVIPLDFSQTVIEQTKKEISLSYVANGEVATKLNLSEEGVRIDGRLLEVNSETHFNDDLVMNAGLIRSADGAIDIDLNAGVINLGRPLTINARPVATVDDVEQSLADAVKSIDVEYAVSSDSDSAPQSGWNTAPPKWEEGKFIWSRTITTFKNGDTEITNPVNITGARGESGNSGRSISNIQEQYYMSTSPIDLENGSWQNTPPTWEDGKYMWTRSVITYANPSGVDRTDPVSITGSKGEKGEKGDDAPLVKLSGQTQIIKQSESGVITPSAPFIVNGLSVNTTINKWEYSVNGGNFTGSTPVGVTRTNSAVTVNPRDVLFNTLTIRISDGNINDEFTIARAIDGDTGADGEDAHTVVLTNESHTFAGGVTNAISGSTTTDILAYKGTMRVPVTISSVSGLPNGMSENISNNGRTNARITFSVNTSMTEQSGVVDINLTLDGVEIKKEFSYSLALKGDKGDKGDTGERGATGEKGPRGSDGTSITSISEHYLVSSKKTGVTAGDSGWSETIPTMTPTNKYLWNYEEIYFSDGTSQPTLPVVVGVYGDKGEEGEIGRSIVDIEEKYLATNLRTGVTRSTDGWTSNMQLTTPVDNYLWNYEIITWNKAPFTTYVEPIIIGVHGEKGDKGEQGPRGLQGLEGPEGRQGIPGDKGADGKDSYTHIAYATGDQGQSFNHSTFPQATHIGMYVSSNQNSSGNWRDYEWTLIKGKDGSQGLQGPKGDDGRTPYFHTAWANNSTGTSGFSTTVSLNKTHIGTYTDFVQADSSDPSKYNWTLIKGEKGDKGDDGARGATGSEGPRGPVGTSITGITEWYMVSPQATGILNTNAGFRNTFQQMTPTNKYLWNYEEIHFSDGTSDKTIAVVVGVYGDKGESGGTGATGRSITGISERYLATSASSGVTRSTSGWTPTMQVTTETNRYLWNYEIITWSSGTTTTYVEPIIIGVHGARGPEGIRGPKGDDGVSQYTHIRFSANANGSGMTTTPQANTKYIGITTTSSATAPAYTAFAWSKYVGEDGNPGQPGQPGQPGKDGQSSYVWYKYAEDDKGTNMSNFPDGMKYIGIAYNKTTPSESNNPNDYTWSAMYDEKAFEGIGLNDKTEILSSNLIDEHRLKFLPNARSKGYSDAVLYELFNLDANQVYTLSTDIDTTNAVYFNGTGSTNATSKGNSTTMTADSTGYLWLIIFPNRGNGSKLIDGEYYLKLEKGSTANLYSPYGSVFTDKADDDSVVHVEMDGKSVGGGSGKNLATVHEPLAITLGGARATILDHRIRNLPLGTYTISYDYIVTEGDGVPTGFLVHTQLTPNRGHGSSTITHRSGRASNTFTIPSGYENLGLSLYSGSSAAEARNYSVIFSNIQIEEGSQATLYEPPAPTPDYPIEINSVNNVDIVSNKGRNLLLNSNNTTAIIINSNNHNAYPITRGVESGVDWFYQNYTNGTYVISTYVNPIFSSSIGSHYSKELENYSGELTYSIEVMSSEPVSISLRPSSGVNPSSDVILTPNKWTRLETKGVGGIRGAALFGDNNYNERIPTGTKIYWRKYKIEKGSTATPYSQAPEDIQSDELGIGVYKTNLLLDEPLRSAGNGRDRLFRDSDGLWKVERNIYERTFTSVVQHYTNNKIEGLTRFRVNTPTDKQINSDGYTNLITNMFKTVGVNNGFGGSEVGFSAYSASGQRNFFYGTMPTSLLSSESLAGLNEYFAQNPLTIQFEVTEPTIEVLSQELQDKLNNIASFKDSNYVYTIFPDKTDTLSEQLKPTLHATFKGGGWNSRRVLNEKTANLGMSLNDLENTTLPALKDGMFDKAEKESVRQSLNMVRSDKASVDAQYNSVYNNSALTGTPKTNLGNAKSSYNTAFNNLESAINTVLNVVEGTRITDAQYSNVQTRFTNYSNALTVVTQRYEEALDAISGKKVGDAVATTIADVDVEFAQNTSATVAPTSGWNTNPPTWREGMFIWSRTVTTTKAGGVTRTNPVNVTGAKGDTGSTGSTGSAGRSVSNLQEQYYLSTSKTSQVGGSWANNFPTWKPGMYVWTRIRIDYSNPSGTAYTDPVIDSSWEAIDGIELGGRNLLISSQLDRWADRFTENTTELLKGNISYYFNFIVQLEANTTYTISNKQIIHDGSGGETANTLRVEIFNETTSLRRQTAGTLLSGESLTFTTNADILQTDKLLFYPAGNSLIDFEVHELKLEKGNKATDWTEAPEDTQAKIDAKAEQKALDDLATDVSDWETRGLTDEQRGEVDAAMAVYEKFLEDIENAVYGKRDENGNLIDEESKGALAEIDEILTATSQLTTDFGDFAQRWNFTDSTIVFHNNGLLIGVIEGAGGDDPVLSTGVRISPGNKEKNEPSRIDFVDSGGIVAEITSEHMRINRAIFVKSIEVGEHKIETMANGHTIWRWMG